MTEGHTPGPWEVREGYAIFAPKGFKPYSVRIADCLGYKEDREANARLIAAAPELLADLEFAVKLLSNLAGGTAQVERLRAAIAKARG